MHPQSRLTDGNVKYYFQTSPWAVINLYRSVLQRLSIRVGPISSLYRGPPTNVVVGPAEAIGRIKIDFKGGLGSPHLPTKLEKFAPRSQEIDDLI